jgi:hypothetical protein
MKPPIFILENVPEDILILRAVEDVSKHLEPADILGRPVPIPAYDSEGRLLELAVVRERRPKKFFGLSFYTTAEFIQIKPVEEIPQHSSELREVLIEFLRFRNPDSEFKDFALEELVKRASKYQLK